ncbi:hypothetical protein AVEN_40252-1 [Araneus ventricosus]|uniref:Uncharacterized protein n=1 Tax=Araneus ventricosus TaxID=182803 RepID=A0A4Y2P6L4_ARAVE|nr:hypothetical protein AVEN_40252-1 [Araneus ventricosus]
MKGLKEPIPNSVEILSPSEVMLKKCTSSGRCVKTPRRLDLLNQICYELSLFTKTQRWGGCCVLVKRSEVIVSITYYDEVSDCFRCGTLFRYLV